MTLIQNFYKIKPFIPRIVQLILRRQIIRFKRRMNSYCWPIDHRASRLPENWEGWPENKQFAFVLMHDVDTAKGQDNCQLLMHLEKQLGFRSSFNLVPERYQVSEALRKELASNGFEIAVHGLKHDGKLFASESIFRKRAMKINEYLQSWDTVGFSSPSMHHNLDWMHFLNALYGVSTFDTDPFEPQPDGVGTIFPFSVKRKNRNRDYIELPYTLPQDFTLFVLMQNKDINIWKQKLDWVAEKGGMALLNTHPDYMNFNDSKQGSENYPAKLYYDFLTYAQEKYQNHYWQALPSEVAEFWINRQKSFEED